MSAHTGHTGNFALSFTSSQAAGATSNARRNPGALSHAFQWLVGMARRRAVINELSSLSDHELNDIGLSRADVSRVFERGFRAERSGF